MLRSTYPGVASTGETQLLLLLLPFVPIEMQPSRVYTPTVPIYTRSPSTHPTPPLHQLLPLPVPVPFPLPKNFDQAPTPNPTASPKQSTLGPHLS